MPVSARQASASAAISARDAGAAHLPGVQRRAARAVDAVAGSGFTHGKQTFHVGLPPAVDANAAVVMLGAEGDLQQLGVQIHAFVAIEIDGRAEADTRACQIFLRFRQQGVIGKRAAHRVRAVVEIHTPPLACFLIHQNVDDQAAVSNFTHIKRPLVGSHAGGATARVVVGLVTDVLAVAVAGERHAQLDQF